MAFLDAILSIMKGLYEASYVKMASQKKKKAFPERMLFVK